MPAFVVAAFYKFAALPNAESLIAPLEVLCAAEQLCGTILLATEGVNGTVAGPRRGIDALISFLRSQPPLADLETKESFCESPPFHRMKVRLKPEIVTIGDSEISPPHRVGTYIQPEHWNTLLEDPEVIVIDTRNVYETRLGTFQGALDPNLASFRDFPHWVAQNLNPEKHRKVAMYCTGGIRCEKASSLLLREGFSQVFHLQGGILKYLEQVAPEESKWQGECFVFDQRVSLDHQLQPGQHRLCYGCQEPVSPDDMASPHYESGVCCPRCHNRLDEVTKAGRRERAKQVALSNARGERHIGDQR